MHTLEVLGYLRRAPDSKHYGVTNKLLQFAYNYVRGNELIDKASPYLLDMSRTIGETPTCTNSTAPTSCSSRVSPASTW